MTRIKMRTVFIKFDLEGNQAIQTEIHPLDIDSRQTRGRSNWLKKHHIMEVQILMREIILLHVHRVEQKLPSTKENTNHQIISGETLRIGYVFKKRIDHDFLLHRVPSTCNHGNKNEEFESLRPLKLFREKLVLFVCPLEITCPKAMSQLLQVLGDNKSSQNQIANISSYFKTNTSATQTTREGTPETLETVEEQPHPAEEEFVPPAPLSHGKRAVIKNLIKRSGKILSKKRKKTPIENKDLYGYITNSDRQGPSTDHAQCDYHSTDNQNIDMSEAIHKNQETEHQIDKDFKDAEQYNNLDEGYDIKIESIDLQGQTERTMCGDTSSPPVSIDSGHVNTNRGFDTDVSVYSEEQLKHLGINMDIIPVQLSSSSSVSIIPVKLAARMNSYSDLNIDDSVLPCFDFLEQKTDAMKMEDICDNSRHRNSDYDLVQFNKFSGNLAAAGYSDSDVNHTSSNLSPQTSDVMKAQTNESSEEDELECLKENSRESLKSVHEVSQRKKHLMPNLSPASSSSENDFSNSRRTLKQNISNCRKRKNVEDENLTEKSLSKCSKYGIVDNNDTIQSEGGQHSHRKDDLPSIACPKRRARKQHANNETINDNGDLPKLYSSQNKRRKIFTDISQNKATSGEGVSVYDFDLQEEELLNSSSHTSGNVVNLSPRKQTAVSSDSQSSGMQLLPKLSRSRSKTLQPKSKKQVTLDFLSSNKQKEADNRTDESVEAEDLDSASFDCVLLEQLSDLPKVKNEASQDLLREVRNVSEVSELNEEHLRFLVLEARQYLKEIFQGKIMCDRHNRYKQGGVQRSQVLVDTAPVGVGVGTSSSSSGLVAASSTPVKQSSSSSTASSSGGDTGVVSENLNYHVHLGLFTEEQQDVVMETLMSIFCKKNHKFLEYIMKVLLPEMLIKIHMEVHGSSHSETEEIMQDVLRKPGGIHI